MTATMVRPAPCHRSSISGYMDGCRCSGCLEADRRRQRKWRDDRRRAAGANEACQICGARFLTRGGLYVHETRIHG